MAQIHGRNTVLTIFNSSAASSDVSADLNNVTLAWTEDNPDVTTFGDNTVQRIDGIKDYSLTCTGIWNSGTSASTVIDHLDDFVTGSGIVLFKWYPGGKTTGSPFWMGCALLSAYDEGAPVNGAVTISFTLVAGAGSLSSSTV